MELAALLLQHPEIAAHQGEILAGLPLSDPSLDRFRHELLNLATSGFRLENPGLENHLVRTGMAELVERLKARMVAGGDSTQSDQSAEEDVEARWLGAARQLREIAELAPERLRAMERFKSEATEESWREALATRIQPNEG
jgi:DNA primase